MVPDVREHRDEYRDHAHYGASAPFSELWREFPFISCRRFGVDEQRLRGLREAL